MYKFKNKQTPKIFNNIIDTPVHQYPTKSSKANLNVKKVALRSTKYSISIRGPNLEWILDKWRKINRFSRIIFSKNKISITLYWKWKRVFLNLELSAGTDVLGCL